eukprot:11303640-Alexandrium_andersonii.AAC.1
MAKWSGLTRLILRRARGWRAAGSWGGGANSWAAAPDHQRQTTKAREPPSLGQLSASNAPERASVSVSYTHLTLPTICSV